MCGNDGHLIVTGRIDITISLMVSLLGYEDNALFLTKLGDDQF